MKEKMFKLNLNLKIKNFCTLKDNQNLLYEENERQAIDREKNFYTSCQIKNFAP